MRRVGPKLRFEGKAAIGNRCKPVVCALVRIAKNVPVKDLETGLGARHNHRGVGTSQARNLPEGLAEIGNAEIRVKKAISAVSQCAAIAAIEARAGDIRNLARRNRGAWIAGQIPVSVNLQHVTSGRGRFAQTPVAVVCEIQDCRGVGLCREREGQAPACRFESRLDTTRPGKPAFAIVCHEPKRGVTVGMIDQFPDSPVKRAGTAMESVRIEEILLKAVLDAVNRGTGTRNSICDRAHDRSAMAERSLICRDVRTPNGQAVLQTFEANILKRGTERNDTCRERTVPKGQPMNLPASSGDAKIFNHGENLCILADRSARPSTVPPSRKRARPNKRMGQSVHH